MTNKQKENVQKWIKALRSGDYKQTTAYLKTRCGDCCIGVACEIMNIRMIATDEGKLFGFYFDGFSEFFLTRSADDNWFKATFGDEIDQLELSSMNDSGLFSFNAIADYLEEKIKVMK